MRNACIYLFLLLLSFQVSGQIKPVPFLERRITIERQGESIEKILTEISLQSGIIFSYSPVALNASRKVSMSVNNQTVRFALNGLFDSEVTYRQHGKFLILQPVKPVRKDPPSIVEGYLTNAQGDLLTDATVYNSSSKTAATTDKYGYFRLKIDAKNLPDTLKVSKEGFADALLMPVLGKTTFVNLSLPTSEDSDSLTIREEPVFFPPVLVSHRLQVNSSNVKESITRVFQLSLFPHIGTNSLLSGSTSNVISLNILGGYIESLKAFEAGSLVNIVRRNAGVAQFAGLGNFVGGCFNGIQSAGLLNVTGKNFNGLQAAGISNTTRGNFKGLQSASIINSTLLNFSGLQATGLINTAGMKAIGLQAAGIMNYTAKVEGSQIAGIMNIAHNSSGAQIAGIINHSKISSGVQISGVINNSDTLKGVQVVGVLNRAKFIKGVQMGVINIADTCEGIQFGLINICRKGIHQIDIYSTETFYTNIAYRGGNRHFYTILMAGYDPRTLGEKALYTYGMGIGTSFGNKPHLNYDIDFLSQQVAKGGINDQINMLYRLGFGVNCKLVQSIALTLGITYNMYLVDSSTSLYASTFSKLPPYFISNESAGTNRNLKTWIGFKAGIRLF